VSVVMSVLLSRSTMPRPGEWATAIRSNGFDMDMDSDFDASCFTGFIPCKYGGNEAGFEYLCEAASKSKLADRLAARVGHRDTVVRFVTHSDLRELATSMIASAVLCSLTDGILWETEADPVVTAPNALEWARVGEASVKAALGKMRRRPT
jgi:hypothetical protein